jgi:hypothetical protein
MRRNDEFKCKECKDTKYLMKIHRGINEFHEVPCKCQTPDFPLNGVYQPDSMGCMIAAVATIVGKTYMEVKQLVNVTHDFEKEGTTCHVTDDILDYYGYAVQRRGEYSPRLKQMRDKWPLQPWADVIMCEVRNTRDSGLHAVVLVKDGRVWDPHWGILQGLHRYPRVATMTAVYKIETPTRVATPLQEQLCLNISSSM